MTKKRIFEKSIFVFFCNFFLKQHEQCTKIDNVQCMYLQSSLCIREKKYIYNFDNTLVWNSRRPYVYWFWIFFQALRPYLRPYFYQILEFFPWATDIFNILFGKFQRPTFIPCPTFILFDKFSRPYVYSLPYVNSRG